MSRYNAIISQVGSKVIFDRYYILQQPAIVGEDKSDESEAKSKIWKNRGLDNGGVTRLQPFA